MFAQPSHGIARITISGDGQGYLPVAKHLLQTTLERMRAGDLSQLSTQVRLSDDAYCYVVCAGGINQVHIVAGSAAAESIDEFVHVGVPDFVSGVVQNGYIETVPADPPRPAYTTMQAFAPTLPTQRKFHLGEGYQPMPRLTVEPYSGLTD
ncbi:MAG: hypothetical protein ACREN3_13980, partial [Gemmatimonadaceae bacterium]